MKKSILKLLIIITITSLTLFSFAGCKSPDTTELDERIEKLELEKTIKELEDELAKKEAEKSAPEEKKEEATEDTADTEEMEEEEDGEEEPGDADADKEAPTISLTIYEGPTLDGNICYYRVQAAVTGSPKVSFSKDDSGGAWGSKKVQVNLNNPGDTYTLTATATNSEGSTTDSIVLNWGCAIPPTEKDVNINGDASLSGIIIVNQSAAVGQYVLMGDDTNNKQIKAYLSFDIDDLGDIDDITIKDVSASIPIDLVQGNPEAVLGSEVNIRVYDYGNSLEITDGGAGGELVYVTAATNTLTDLNFSSNKLEDELQKAVDIDKKWFQLKIILSGVSLNNTLDYYRIPVINVVLHVKYEIPG